MDASEHIKGVEDAARDLALRLNAASDDGVSAALLLPRLIIVFREVFGEVPPNIMQLMGGLK